MIRKITKRILTTILSATVAFSSLGVNSYAADSTNILSEEYIDLESSEDSLYDNAINGETSIADDTIVESDAENTTSPSESTEYVSGEESLPSTSPQQPETLFEFHVAPGYENEYTDADIEDYFRSNFTEEELLPDENFEAISEEDSLTSTASDLRSALVARESSFSYTSSSHDVSDMLDEALKDTNEKDPTGGDYIRGNLIGYQCSGHGYGGVWYITVNFIWASYGNAASEEKQVTQKVAQIVKELNLKSSDMSEFDKVLAVHDYLCQNIDYVNDGYYGCHGAYAAFIKGKCVCQGYANAFTRLAREAGLPAKYIIGAPNHAWNIVRVLGGAEPERPWYNMDVTWDDGYGNNWGYGYFLKNALVFTDHERDDEFETTAYNNAHPMAHYSWGMTEYELLNVANPSVELTCTDGTILSTTANGRPKLLYCYDPLDTADNSYTKLLLKSFAQSSLIKKNKLDMYVVPLYSSTDEDVPSYEKAINCPKIKFTYYSSDFDYQYLLNRELTGSIISCSPSFIFIDEHDRIQFINTSGFITATTTSRVIMYHLKDYWDPSADAKSVEIRKFDDADAAAEGTTYKKVTNKSTLNIKFGQELYLKAAALPNKKGILDWTDHCRVQISGTTGAISYAPETGHLEGINKGTATITFMADYNEDVKASVKVKVAAAPITGISFDRAVTALKVGTTDTLILSHVPVKTTDDIAGASPVFSSSDESIVKIGETVKIADSPGQICSVTLIPVGVGSTTVTAKCLGKTTTCKVTVNKTVESYNLIITSESYNELFVGEKESATLNFYPMDATPAGGFIWSMDGNAAELLVDDNGYGATITGISPGIADVYVTLEELPASKKTRHMSVNVKSADLVLDPCAGTLPEGADSTIPGLYGKAVGSLPVPEREGFIFMGWFTQKDCDGTRITENTLITRSIFSHEIKAYAGWSAIIKDSITIAPVEDYVYTGAAIKPVVTVYYGKELLSPGKDYTVSYKNNKNRFTLNEGDPGYLNSKGAVMAPTVIVKGKGNYAGEATATFRILPRALTYSDISIDEKKTHFTANGKMQKAAPTVKFGKATLKKDKDFVFVYNDEFYRNMGNYTLPGKYNFKITAVEGGNYTDSLNYYQFIERNDLTSIAKCKITCPKSVAYDNGKELIPTITVKSGKAVLVEGKDYTVEAVNNREIGTATLIIRGIGACSGYKKQTFKITGSSIAKAVVALENSSFAYNGKEHRPAVSVRLTKTAAESLVQNTDYTVSYNNNVNKGKATVLVTGIGKYTGSVKKTFSITAAPASGLTITDTNGNADISEVYVKNAVTPDIKVTMGGMALTPGKDYTVKYTNNSKVYTLSEKDAGFDAAKAACITVSGKGNFAGSKKVFFRITPSVLQNKIGEVMITAPDVIYSSAAGKWKSAVTIVDKSGKKLAPGTDYDKNVQYVYATDATMTDGSTRAAGTTLDAKDSPISGTIIDVTVIGIGNYGGTVLSGKAHGLQYRIIDKDKSIASGITFKIPDQTYTGSEVTFDESVIEFTASASRTGFDKTNFEVIPGSFVSNVNTGTAKVTVRGINGFGGNKTITFKIVSKNLK